jgi:hypothetical protein
MQIAKLIHSVFTITLTLTSLNFFTSAMAAPLCPSPKPNDTFCITSTNSPFIVPTGWKAASVVVMEDGTEMIFDPRKQLSWRLDFGQFVIGQNAILNLSGSDADGKATNGGNGADGPREGNGQAGGGGADGVKGGDSVGLEIHVQNLRIGGLTIVRNGGRGQEGGNGGTGGAGGGATCQHNAGDGGIGGVGGMGGAGGNVKAVKIFYGKLSLNSESSKIIDVAKSAGDIAKLKDILSSIGVVDSARAGQGGIAGASNHGGRQEGGTSGCGVWPVSWSTGGGVERSNEYPASKGRGPDGYIEEFVVKPENLIEVSSGLSNNNIKVNVTRPSGAPKN